MIPPFGQLRWWFGSCVAFGSFLFLSGLASAQEEQTGLCAPVKILISQQLTLERVGFLATMQITDNDGTDPITDFSVNLTFENPALSTNGTVNDSSSLFFVQPPTLQNIQNVSGNGIIGPSSTATISWFIIPTVNAGGGSPSGVLYNIGASLSGKLRGLQIPASSMAAIPAPITVYPDAQLQINYFTPRDVQGINPFTLVGSPIPFTFGVLVKNVGYGAANNLVIASQQPQIVENVQNLPLVAQLLGSAVNGFPTPNANLTVNFGTLNPGQTVEGAWDMICTFSGTFLSVNATYTHSTALGGQETSLIQSVNAYLFLHQVLDDSPGKDNVPDFLTDASGTLDNIENVIPDSLYESDGSVLPVNFLTNATAVGNSSPVTVELNAGVSGWGYMRLHDPEQNKLPILSVVRSDGKVLNTNNYWTNIHYEPGSNIEDYYLDIFDLVGFGSYSYTVTYTNAPSSTNPPVTSIMFAGPSTYTNGVYFITPQTTIYFLSQDVSPVTIVYSLTNSPFLPAIPFSLPTPGTYSISYYATDSNGNRETNHTATLIIPGPDSLGFGSVSIPSQPFFVPGGALSVRPVNTPISFSALPNGTPLNAQIDIFQGVLGWATVSNVPASPTVQNFASLTIGGQDVDYYIYQMNGGTWSAEQSVSTPLTLNSLAGPVTVSVLGRSQYGGYLDPTNAVTVSWTVDPSAPGTLVTGGPATPSRTNAASFNVGGAGVTDYKWTLNDSYYRPSSPAADPILFNNLLTGLQLLDVLGGTNGVDQPTNRPTAATWTINPLYGYDFSSLTDVFTVPYSNLAGAVTFNWDGKNKAGDILPAGWYTVRVTLTDSLGDTNFTTGLVEINPLAGSNTVVAGFNRDAQNPSARGRWAVWQDQSDGNWEIYAQDVSSNSPMVKITTTALSQEDPQTDGRYVVWQSLQTNGSWDVDIDDLEGTSGPQAVTSTPAFDEINPAIDWPWMVCQVRATGNTNAPWQVFAYNLTNGQNLAVSPSGEDELDPAVQAGRVVWQDFRDPGPGEIYFYDLLKSQLRRITTNIYGQYHPAIEGNWIVWQDNRNIELDIYGFDLLRNREIQVTDTPEDETQPVLNGLWVICAENSLGPQTGNIRLIHLPSLLTIPITRTPTMKSSPTLADGWAVWQETVSNQNQVAMASLPTLQPGFHNRNMIAVTAGMASYAQNAFGLLSLWSSNGVQQVTQYPSLSAPVSAQTAVLSNGAFSGLNFTLVPGSFLWLKFNQEQVLDLGVNNSSAISLATGGNVVSYAAFPDGYNAYTLLTQVGLNDAVSVRLLDAQSGRWRLAQVENGNLTGDNFPIPRVAVLMVAVTTPVNNFVPHSP